MPGLLLLIALMSACGGSAPPAAPPGGGMPAMPVEVIDLTSKPVEQVGEFVGIVKSRRSTTIMPQAEGVITRIAVKSGDRVAPGAVLFEIDAASQRAAVGNLESLKAAREADAAYAQQQAARAKALVDVGAMSQQELEQAMTAQKTADAQVKAVEQQIQQGQAELAYYRVAAPTAGIVGDIPGRVGERVTKTTALTTVDDSGGLELYVNVPVQQAPGLKAGMPVRIVGETGDVIASQKISFVAPSVDDKTQTVLVKTPLDSMAGQFRTDQFVRAQVVFSTAPGLSIPVTSVIRINGQYFVFVAEAADKATVAHQRAVTVGPVVGNEYVVLSGLKAGEKLIVSGIQKIGDGSPVATSPAGIAKPAAAKPGGGL
ncbi:MAG: efflux RND transporter periplasmic adaptor subunit [Acidobacteriota bacterium]